MLKPEPKHKTQLSLFNDHGDPMMDVRRFKAWWEAFQKASNKREFCYSEIDYLKRRERDEGPSSVVLPH